MGRDIHKRKAGAGMTSDGSETRVEARIGTQLEAGRLDPARRERLADIIYGQLMRELASGLYVEGDRLPTEKDLSIKFDVSRPVIREALMRLSADGLVVARQGAGTFVKRRPPKAIADYAEPMEFAGILRAFEVRIGLEGQAARLAAGRRSEAELTRIGQCLDQMRIGIEAGASARVFDFAFHRAVAEASGNALFAEVLDALEERITAGMGVALGITGAAPAPRSERVLAEHARIYEAIAEGDPDSAEIAMRYHIDQARRRMTDRRREA
jgi:GntR family transcriptional regulator, transcriptional repressor for pyruvate dehydrogenase complex